MISQFSSRVLSREKLREKIFKLTFSSPLIFRKAKPGNFVHIKVNSGDLPLLRRPFSIHRVEKDKSLFEILFKVVGEGTEILSRKSPGETLDILGPIGNSFSLPRGRKEILLVAGGMGMAPLWFLFSRLIQRVPPERLTFFLGAKSKKELLYADELKETKAKLILATDDGTAGRRGAVTEVFFKEIRKRGYHPENIAVYSCGPDKMLKRISRMAKRMDFFCQISLETHMPCGVGACWGCVVKHKDQTYKRACVDGPVFDARMVELE